MSISIMRKAAAVVLAAGTFAGCARAQALDPAAQDRLDAARSDATEAMDAVEDLETRLEGLQDDLDEAAEASEEASEKVDKASERLWASLAKLRKTLEDARAGASDAAANADAALVRAEQAARDLAVLGSRYDSHLRRYHGGG